MQSPTSSFHSNSNSPTKKNSIQPSEFSKKSRFLCTFCGGKKCKHENYLNHPKAVIKGLNSDWITDRFLAMQRPSSRLIKEFDIITQFKNADIRAVFNLQEPGEHANCGDGNRKESGFSYLPEEFFENGIFFYNFHWKDMTNTEFSHLLKIVSMIEFTYQQGGKIAVHCHAGKGRTAVVICSWLIFNGDYTATEAIKLFKSIREGSLKKEKQKVFLEDFQEYCAEVRRSYYKPITSVQDLLKIQSPVIFGDIKNETKHLPLVLYKIFDFLKKDVELGKIEPLSIVSAFYDLENQKYFKSKWLDIKPQLNELKEKINKMKDLDYIFTDLDVRLCIILLLDFFDQFNDPPITNKSISLIYDFMTKESPDFVVIFQNNDITHSMEKYEFYIMDEIVKFATIVFKKNPEISLIKNYFLRVSLSLLGKTSQYSSCFIDDSLNLSKENLDLLNKDDFLKKLRQIFWLWYEEVRSVGEAQINEIEESFKSVSSPVLVKKKHLTEDNRKRAKTAAGAGKTKFFGLRPVETEEEEEKI